MRIFKCVLITVLVALMITAGCLSGGKLPGTAPSTPNTTLVAQVTTVNPPPTTLQESYADKITGSWKTLNNSNGQEIFWQFDANGTLTGGNAPGSHDITGNWSSIGFRNLFELTANGAGSKGNNTTYDIVFYYEIETGKVLVNNPAEDGNLTFIRQ